MENKSASLMDLSEWQKRQADYTIPLTPTIFSAKIKDGLKTRYALYGLLGLCIGGVACSYGLSSMSIPAIAKTTLASLTQAAMSTRGALVAGGAITYVGAGVLVISSIAALFALAIKNLPGMIGVMSANLLHDGELTLFEFFGTGYGAQLDAFRTRVFKAVLPEKTWVRKMCKDDILAEMRKDHPQANPSEDQIQAFQEEMLRKARKEDLKKGPSLSQLVRNERFNLLDELVKIKAKVNDASIISDQDMDQFAGFIKKFGDQKLFAFLHGIHPDKAECRGTEGLLFLDRFKKELNLPLLSANKPLILSGSHEPKQALLAALFQPDVTRMMKCGMFSPEKIKQVIHEDLDLTLLKDTQGHCVTPQELEFFASPAGQWLFFWLYHAEDWDLALQVTTVEELNQAREAFAALLGSPQKHAEQFVKDLLATDVSVLAVQECGQVYAEAIKKHFIDPFDSKKQSFSTLFLRKNRWKDMHILQDHGPSKLIMATDQKTKDKFLHATIHGSSNDANDALQKIQEVVETFNALTRQPGNENLTLLIGIDANTKEEVDIRALQKLVHTAGLYMTDYGSTTIKIRALTVQQKKAGLRIDSQGDHVITSLLKGYKVIGRLLGGKRTRAGADVFLPYIKHLSDHLTVQLTIQKIWTIRQMFQYYFRFEV